MVNKRIEREERNKEGEKKEETKKCRKDTIMTSLHVKPRREGRKTWMGRIHREERAEGPMEEGDGRDVKGSEGRTGWMKEERILLGCLKCHEPSAVRIVGGLKAIILESQLVNESEEDLWPRLVSAGPAYCAL